MTELTGDAKWRERLRSALPELHSLEGFPNASDPAILAASIPPAYTACPNPFVADLIGRSSPDTPYRRHPFAADVSVGRSDPIYRGHTYHTKVPPQAIAAYIEHYCPAEGLVFDGFCGSGMTGVAARMTGRRALLVDLSPAATAIAAAYCLPVNPVEARRAFASVLAGLQERCGWLYTTAAGAVTDYVIWSEVYRCPHCLETAPFSEMGFDFATRRPAKTIVCPHCGRAIKANVLQRVVNEAGVVAEVPVRVRDLGQARERSVDERDLALLRRVQSCEIPFPHPDGYMMGQEPSQEGWGDMWRRGYHTGVYRVADFYFHRSLWVVAAALDLVRELEATPEVRHVVTQTIINASVNLTKMRRAYQGPVPLVLYLPRLRRECNAIRALAQRFRSVVQVLERLPEEGGVIISTQSCTSLPNVPSACADYAFTDPPFGQNIIYSEVNHIWEAWMGITTAQAPEAIVSRRQGKGISQYSELMARCFAEFRRVLKPERWMTVVFHNSSNQVWAAIQDALTDSGFVVEDVRILDKQQQSFKQASTQNAVQRDLVLSARSPAGGQRSFPLVSSAPDASVWDFVDQRLRECADTPEECTERALYSRLVQHCLAAGLRVPMDAEEFYRAFRERYSGGKA